LRGEVILAFGVVEYDPIPAILAYQGAINGEQNLLPGAQFLAAVRAGTLFVAFVCQFPTPVSK
jgi:hypothetical protein